MKIMEVTKEFSSDSTMSMIIYMKHRYILVLRVGIILNVMLWYVMRLARFRNMKILESADDCGRLAYCMSDLLIGKDYFIRVFTCG